MAKTPFEDSPDNKPALPGHLAGRDGAVPSSSSGGPSGSGGAARGGAAPRDSRPARRNNHYDFAAHDISDEVRRARPYDEFESVEQLRSLYPLEQLADNQLKDVSKMVNHMEKVGGIVINRVPAPGYPPITPELRPSVPFPRRMMGPHYQGEKQDAEFLATLVDSNGKKLHPSQILTPHKARCHIPRPPTTSRAPARTHEADAGSSSRLRHGREVSHEKPCTQRHSVRGDATAPTSNLPSLRDPDAIEGGHCRPLGVVGVEGVII
jgi:hypothetical protein